MTRWTKNDIRKKGLHLVVSRGNKGENSKLERYTSRRAKKALRDEKEVERSGSHCYRLKFICWNARERDLTNLCVKYYEDGLIELGIIPDDSPKYVKGIEYEQRLCKKGEEKTEIEVWQEVK